jgi:hypothetical protein
LYKSASNPSSFILLANLYTYTFLIFGAEYRSGSTPAGLSFAHYICTTLSPQPTLQLCLKRALSNAASFQLTEALRLEAGAGEDPVSTQSIGPCQILLFLLYTANSVLKGQLHRIEFGYKWDT